MDFFVGIKGPDFVMVCSDTSAVHSIIMIKQDEDKIVPIDSHKLFCLSGEAGDRVQFSDYIIANTKLYALRNATRLSTKSVAHYTRGELAVALRKVRSRRVAARAPSSLSPSLSLARAHSASTARAHASNHSPLKSNSPSPTTQSLHPLTTPPSLHSLPPRTHPTSSVAVPHQPAARRL